MMGQSNSPNPAEKQRLREAINRHVNRYLERGGTIRVIEAPQESSSDRLMSSWHNGQDYDAVLD